MKSLRRLARLRSGESITSEEIADGGQYPVYGGNGVRGFTTRFTHCGFFVLIGRQGALCGNVNYAAGEFWASEHAVVVAPLGDWSTVWMGELLRSMDLNRHSQSAAQPGLSAERVSALLVPVPPRDEQEAIAALLHRKTATIDALVAKKRTSIELLSEKRAALISHTITRGLPPDAARAAGLEPNRDFQVSAIGEIPAHWSTTRLMRLTDPQRPIMYGIVLPGPDVPDGVPIVKGGDVKPGRLRLANLCRTTVEIEAAYARSRLRAGDIVFSIRGTVGDAEIVPEEIAGANLTQDAARIAPGPGVHLRWLLYAVKAKPVLDPLLSLSLGAAVRGVNIRDLKRLLLGLPPLVEQAAIAQFLDLHTARIDAMVSKIETAIERLHEYRSALTTAAVTGKIDVRGAAT